MGRPEIPAEVLREAARVMRKRAEAATSGPWIVDGLENGEHGIFIDSQRDLEAEGLGCGGTQVARWMTDFNAEHLASWHPAVAIAVADWLDAAGADLWAHGPLCECGTGCEACDDNLWEPHVRHALAVARTYLGSAA